MITVRPERVAFAGPGAGGALTGTVRSRIFQGAQWMFEIESEAGTLTVIRQNDGMPMPSEGDAVALVWRAEDMTIAARGEAP